MFLWKTRQKRTVLKRFFFNFERYQDSTSLFFPKKLQQNKTVLQRFYHNFESDQESPVQWYVKTLAKYDGYETISSWRGRLRFMLRICNVKSIHHLCVVWIHELTQTISSKLIDHQLVNMVYCPPTAEQPNFYILEAQ